MARREPPRRRLIVNADDFGASQSVNEAVIRAHCDGILTTASLMVNEPGCEDAVARAREHPRLGVGLHLALLHGDPALPRDAVPGLLGPDGQFSRRPVLAGVRFFFQRSLLSQIEAEIAAQFARFRATGLRLDHVNGHLHMHLHPVVFDILMRRASEWGVTRVRLTRDRFWLNARLARGHWFYRASHAIIYRSLSARARSQLDARNIRFTTAVFGLLQHGRVDERYVSGLLANLPAGDSELYSHPSLHEFKHEFNALVSPVVRQRLRAEGIELIRYQDL